MSNTSNTEQIAIQVANDQQVAVAIAFSHEPEPDTEPDTNSNFFNTTSFSTDENSTLDDENAELWENTQYAPDHIKRHVINLTTVEGTLDPVTVNANMSAEHFYNNPESEGDFLLNNLFPFLCLTMIGSLLYWITQSTEDITCSDWFRVHGYRRLFLESLTHTLARLPYPRIFNVCEVDSWLELLHRRSPDIRLLQYPWLNLKEFATTGTSNHYKNITTHWYTTARFHHSGFIVGAQSDLPGNEIGSWNWKKEFYRNLPWKCLDRISRMLPGLRFELKFLTIVDIVSEQGTPMNPGFWHMHYGNLAIVVKYNNPNQRCHYISFDDCDRLVSSPGITHWLDQTVLCPQFPDHSPLPVDHVEPGYFTLTPPYIGGFLNPDVLRRQEYYRTISDDIVRETEYDQTVETLLRLRTEVGKQAVTIEELRKDNLALAKREDTIKRVVETHSKQLADIHFKLNSLTDLFIPILQAFPSLFCKVDSLLAAATSSSSSSTSTSTSSSCSTSSSSSSCSNRAKRKRDNSDNLDEKETGSEEASEFAAWENYMSSFPPIFAETLTYVPYLLEESAVRAREEAQWTRTVARGIKTKTTSLADFPPLVRDPPTEDPT